MSSDLFLKLLGRKYALRYHREVEILEWKTQILQILSTRKFKGYTDIKQGRYSDR